MKDNKNDSCVLRYEHNGKLYYEVSVQKRDKFGKVRKKSSRFTDSGKRITSKVGINQILIKLREEINFLVDQKSIYTWKTWKNICVDRMRLEGLKESTIQNYDGILDRWQNPEWSSKLITSFERKDVHAYFHDYLPQIGASDWTRKNIHKRIFRMFEIAVDDGEIYKNPARGIKISTPTYEGVALTTSEVQALLSKAKTLNHPYYPHWVIALMTGLRNGELYSLRYEQINFGSNTILINQQFTPKDGLHPPKKGKVRTIDLNPELRAFIEKLRIEIGPQSQILWKHTSHQVRKELEIGGSKTGKFINQIELNKEYVQIDDLILPRIRSWSRGNQAKELRDFCKEIGIRECKFHDLRATHITNLLSNGVSLSKVMHQVGHSQLKTTDAYHRLAGVEVKGITQSLGFKVPSNEENPNNVIDLFQKKATRSNDM